MTDSSESRPAESDEDPFVDKSTAEKIAEMKQSNKGANEGEKSKSKVTEIKNADSTPRPRPKRMSLNRTYTNPTYPDHKETEHAELKT